MIRIKTLTMHALAVAAITIGGFAAQAQAAPLSLTSLSSSVTLDPDTGIVSDWLVNGQDQLKEMSFWFRGASGPEMRVADTTSGLSLTNTNNVSAEQVILTYSDDGGAFDIDISYTLAGTNSTSEASDLFVTVDVTNNTNDALALSLFQFTDLDLLDSALNDQITTLFVTPGILGTVEQDDADSSADETVQSTGPDHYTGDAASTILGLLNDGSATTLNDTNNGLNPGLDTDVAWAFQTDFQIGAGSSEGVSKDIALTNVPEPASLAIFGVGLGLICFRARSRR